MHHMHRTWIELGKRLSNYEVVVFQVRFNIFPDLPVCMLCTDSDKTQTRNKQIKIISIDIYIYSGWRWVGGCIRPTGWREGWGGEIGNQVGGVVDGRFGGVWTRQKFHDIQAIMNDVFVGVMDYKLCIYICIHVGLRGRECSQVLLCFVVSIMGRVEIAQGPAKRLNASYTPGFKPGFEHVKKEIKAERHAKREALYEAMTKRLRLAECAATRAGKHF